MNQNDKKYSFGEGGPVVFLFLSCACFHKCVCWLPPGSAGETWCWWVSIWAYRNGSEPQQGLCWGWVMGTSLNLLLERLAE